MMQVYDFWGVRVVEVEPEDLVCNVCGEQDERENFIELGEAVFAHQECWDRSLREPGSGE